jgi:adenylate cyclase
MVGIRKFAYDIWGDTVNTASRMEHLLQPNQITISDDTFQFIKADFHCTSRGPMFVKGKGEMELYFLERERN